MCKGHFMELTVNKPCSVLIQYSMAEGNLDGTELWKSLSSDYQTKIKSLLKQFIEQEDNELTGNFSDWIRVSNYLTEVKAKQLKAGSFRAFRAALKKVLNYGLERKMIDVNVLRDSITTLQATSGLSAKEIAESGSKSTSSKKVKTIKPEEIYALRMYARESQSEYATLAINWLEFNVLTNCRPNEILDAKIIMPTSSNEGVPYLKVKNTIKNEATKIAVKEGKLDTHRYIPLDNCSHHDLVWLSNFLSQFQSKTDHSNYESTYSSTRSQLARMSEATLGKKLSLYAGRTQWAANQKSVLTSKEDIATYMGHTDKGQSERSYGRKSQGWQKVEVRKPQTEEDSES